MYSKLMKRKKTMVHLKRPQKQNTGNHRFTGIMSKTSENSNMKPCLTVFLCLEVSSYAPFSSVALIALCLTHFIQILLEYLSLV